jgi:hypothetical protein
MVVHMFHSLSAGTFAAEDSSVQLDYAGQGLVVTALDISGDLDGGGVDDLLMGAPAAEDQSDWPGVVYVVPMGSVGEILLEESGIAIVGEQADAEAGYSLAVPGDLDDDGFDDLVIGSPGGIWSGGPGIGSAHVIHGPVTEDMDLAVDGTVIRGEVMDGVFGFQVAAAGDINGDGLPDLMVSEPGNIYASDTEPGSVFIFHGPVTTPTGSGDADVTISAGVQRDLFGFSMSSAGDMDGNGHDDIVVGAPFDSNVYNLGGKVYLLLGPMEGAIAATSGDVIDYGAEGHCVGYSIAGGADLDGDQFIDIVSSSPYSDRCGWIEESSATTGVATIYHGDGRGQVSSTRNICGTEDSDRIGARVELMPDGLGGASSRLLVDVTGGGLIAFTWATN